MFNLDLSSALGIIVRTAVIYIVILAGLRLSGKREVGQMTVFDLVVLLLIANAVQNAMVGPDTSLVGGVIAAVVLLLINAAIARLSMNWPRLRHMVEGTPTLLVLHGDVIAEHMRKEGIDEETLEAALREHGVEKIGEVEMAVLEIDGSISVVPQGGITTRVKKPLKFLRHQ
ncbi:MAG: YetF domain-containing protein [Anaerolineales bacterium]|jgi:uncharacterized membrane protein YcaP (DUF421 family)